MLPGTNFAALDSPAYAVCFLGTMELRREHIEAFRRAYKLDIGEDLSYSEAFEIAHRLVNIFLILEKAAQRQARKRQGLEDDEDEE